MAGALLNYNGQALMTQTGAYGINNLIPENIKSGVQIGGITGTFDGGELIGGIIDNTLTTLNNSYATKVPDNKFSNASNLTTINLPNATSVGYRAFYLNHRLTSVSLLSCTSIGQEAFYDCDTMTSLYIPNVTSIGVSAFYYCSALTSVELPSCTSIGSNGFYRCSSLTSMTLGASSVCSLGATNSIPAKSSQHMTIYVPSDLISSYQSASYWSTLYSNGYITFQAISQL